MSNPAPAALQNATSSTDPNQLESPGGEKAPLPDARRDAFLAASRALNAGLAPVVEKEIASTLESVGLCLEMISTNDGEFPKRQLEAAKAKLDDFAEWSASQRRSQTAATGKEPEAES